MLLLPTPSPSHPTPSDSVPVSECHIETFSVQEVPFSAQRKNQKWGGSSRTMGPKKTSMTTYSNWGSLGTRVWGRATCWTSSPQRIQPREQEHHWCGVCHLSIQGNGKTIEAQIWHNVQPRVPAQGNKVSKPLKKSVGVEAAGRNTSLTGELVGVTHRVLESTQTHQPGNEHQKDPFAYG